MRQIADHWKDYECIDAGGGEKLERWGDIILRRPDPQAMWPIAEETGLWRKPHALYHRSKAGGGEWEIKKSFPEFWTIRFNELTFKVSPTGFKHTGLFPEQAVNWEWMQEKIRKAKREIRVLNLFAYTGGATMACASAGASEVVHVDASKGMVTWAKENMALSKLDEAHIRFIIDDVLKFVAREERRGRTYHAIIMDPPSYGRGPSGEIWKLEDQLFDLVEACAKILDPNPLFFCVNAYTTGFSSIVLENILEMSLRPRFPKAVISAGEIGLPIAKQGWILPCGIYGRMSLDEHPL
jgi:23S rRNA (cytosine1962-C5)-methyltransferase